MKSTIKLIGCAMKKTSGDLAVFVSPMVVPLSNPFATAKVKQERARETEGQRGRGEEG